MFLTMPDLPIPISTISQITTNLIGIWLHSHREKKWRINNFITRHFFIVPIFSSLDAEAVGRSFEVKFPFFS